jgi:hypothetical protein
MAGEARVGAGIADDADTAADRAAGGAELVVPDGAPRPLVVTAPLTEGAPIAPLAPTLAAARRPPPAA